MRDEVGAGAVSGEVVALAGASGLVGAAVLSRLLADARVARVVALGRRSLPLTHAKLAAAVVDFADAAALAQRVPSDVSVAVCCLGTTMKQAGSRTAFRAVDHDAVLAFAAAARARGARRFVLVSALGADPLARTFYARTKGETERGLVRLGFAELTVLRPSFIDDRGTRPEQRLGERLVLAVARPLFGVLGTERRYAPITVEVLAHALVRLTLEPGGPAVRIVESEELQGIGAPRG